MKTMIASLILAASTNIVLATPAVQAKRPNIILFVVDDMVRGEIACYGGNVLTPNLNRLAGEGMRFDNGHTVSNVCTPSQRVGLGESTSHSPNRSWTQFGFRPNKEGHLETKVGSNRSPEDSI